MRLPKQRQTPEEKDRAVLPSANSQGIASGIASYGNVSRGTALTLRFGRPAAKRDGCAAKDPGFQFVNRLTCNSGV